MAELAPATARQATAARLMLEIAQALAIAADHRENLPDQALVPLTLGQCRQVRHALRLMATASAAPLPEAADG